MSNIDGTPTVRSRKRLPTVLIVSFFLIFFIFRTFSTVESSEIASETPLDPRTHLNQNIDSHGHPRLGTHSKSFDLDGDITETTESNGGSKVNGNGAITVSEKPSAEQLPLPKSVASSSSSSASQRNYEKSEIFYFSSLSLICSFLLIRL
jgi:hypothetical protein